MRTRGFARRGLAVWVAAAALFVSVGFYDSSGVSASTASAEQRVKDKLQKLRDQKLPAGIVKSNGRLEATQVDVSSKYAGRLSEVSVEEGSSVTLGQIVAKVSSPELEAQLQAAEADLQRAIQSVAAAEADVKAHESTRDYAKAEFERGSELIKSGTITQVNFEQRKRNADEAEAALKSTMSQRDAAQSQVNTAQAQVGRFQAMIADLTLSSPRNGRVQYQLAQAGEVVAAGAPILTILDLTDVYMTIFLPAADAGKLEIGGEARLVLDPIPQYVVPATVTFVAADAQFTPKTVETKDEREKLMFRVKLKINQDVLTTFYKRVKTGIRGLGFVRTTAAGWPDNLQVKLPAQ
jgi:HlyD family secretion protein